MANKRNSGRGDKTFG